MPGTVDNKLIYHLGVLIPFWVLELLAEILVIVAGGLGLASLLYIANNDQGCVYDQYGDYECTEVDQTALNIGYAAAGVELGLGCVFLIMHIVQIALFGRRKLTPAANFGIELSRFIVWLIVFILVIVSFSNGGSTTFSLAFAIIVWALYLGSTIYSIVILHRARRGHYNGSSTNYAVPTAGPAPAVYHSSEPQMQATNVEAGQHFGPGPYQHPSEIQQQPSVTYQSSHTPVSPVSNAHSSQLGSAYAPTHQFTGFPEKEAVNNGH